jgi:ribosomal protein S18 acetylase RimI-like enzyme
MTPPVLKFRQIDATRDAELAFTSYRETCAASFGSDESCLPRAKYLSWLTRRIEEFPDGHVIALLGDSFIGQLELQIPYGLHVGYVNLFYVAPAWRKLGFGRQLHDFTDQYFKSWEAKAIELHVSPSNTAAVNFYRSLGYKTVEIEDEGGRMWKMRRVLLIDKS